MYKQIAIILFALSLFVTEKHGKALPHNEYDAFLAEVRALAKNKMESRRLNSMHSRHSAHLDRWSSFRERGSIDDQAKFQQEMLEAHNTYRARHCTPPLELNDELNNAAMEYAKHLASINEMVHSTGTNQGENLAQEWSSEPLTSVNGAAVTKDWYDEIKLYSYDTPQFSDETGHFTQVVWKESKLLGAGFAITSDGKTVYSVARYAPRGNMKGAFVENVLTPNC